MFNYRYPHTDLHELNLDWLLCKVQELDSFVNNELSKVIREDLDKLFINSMYIPESETLVLILENPNE